MIQHRRHKGKIHGRTGCCEQIKSSAQVKCSSCQPIQIDKTMKTRSTVIRAEEEATNIINSHCSATFDIESGVRQRDTLSLFIIDLEALANYIKQCNISYLVTGRLLVI